MVFIHGGGFQAFSKERIDARFPSLDEVRDIVVREWSAASRKEANEAFYEALRKRYTITVEKAANRSPTQVAMAEGVR